VSTEPAGTGDEHVPTVRERAGAYLSAKRLMMHFENKTVLLAGEWSTWTSRRSPVP
jgi:hypothetical protein